MGLEHRNTYVAHLGFLIRLVPLESQGRMMLHMP